MGHRSIPRTHQMVDVQLEEDDPSRRLHLDQCIPGNIVNFTNQSLHPVFSASVMSAENGIMFEDSHDSRNSLLGNQYIGFQNFHAVPTLGLSAAAPPPSFYDPCMIPASSNQTFPSNWSNGTSAIGISMDNQFADSMRGFGKRKNSEALPGFIQQNEAGSSSSSPSFLSLHCGMPQWDPPYEPTPNPVEATNFAQEGGNMQTALVPSPRYVRVRSSSAGIQPESAYFPHYNYAGHGTHMGQSLQPASNVWMTQFGTGNNVGDTASSNWNYNNGVAYLHGRWLGSGALEMGAQAFSDTSSSTNSGFIFNPPTCLPNFHPNLSVMPPMAVENYGHNAPVPAPYQFPLNNMHPVSVNPAIDDGLHLGFRFPHFPSSGQQFHRPRLLHRSSPDFGRGSVRIISSEDAAVMGLSGIYGVANIVDQHQDMRLDIDQMSYEELLALQEQIGDVKTGLTEEYIKKNLKTSVLNDTCYSSENPTSIPLDPEPCTICQGEYEKDDTIGTLSCSHVYHEKCIRQWLVMKNWCPICKKRALDP